MLRDGSKDMASQRRLNVREQNREKEVAQKFSTEANIFKEQLSRGNFAIMCNDVNKKSW